MVQGSIAIRNTRSDQLRNTTFNQFFGKLRIFELIANSHTFSGTNQLRQISIERMMRETGQFHRFSRAIGPTG